MLDENITLTVTGPLARPDVSFDGPHTDVTGTIDLTRVRGRVKVKFTLLSPGFKFTGLRTSESSMDPPSEHHADPNSQFQDLKIADETLSFEYLNGNARRYNVYALVLTDPAGRERVIDPYIKNGGG